MCRFLKLSRPLLINVAHEGPICFACCSALLARLLGPTLAGMDARAGSK